MSNERPSVLLVDDEARTIELIGSVLEHQGLATTLARQPQDAIRLLRTIQFDAVVTDVVFDGFAEGSLVLAAARDLQPRAVVVLMTGYPDVEAAVAAIKAGAVDYLKKPVDPIVLAAFIHRALSERRVESEDLAFADLVEILSAMVANTIERVDPYTAGHGSRTRKYSRLLATELGLDGPRIERLELAAIAHDYGKIYLEDLGFLTKKGPLTDDEFKAVQRHPLLGAKKLGHHPQLAEVRRIIAEHHEKWDGTGYPHKLSRQEISIAGRILAVAEVFDSLATKRSYKEVWPLERVLDLFEKGRGTHFDPDVVDAWLPMLHAHGARWIRQPLADLEAAGLELGA
jgi:putative two-component system response regulator